MKEIAIEDAGNTPLSDNEMILDLIFAPYLDTTKETFK
jgi:hypothetical protein